MLKGLLGNCSLLELEVGVTEGKDKERYGIFDYLLANALSVLTLSYLHYFELSPPLQVTSEDYNILVFSVILSVCK